MVPLRVGVLGPVTTWRDGHEVPAGQPRQLAVLGVLATRANRVVSRGDLVDAVWGDEPPASAEGGVYTYIAGLRRVLEPDRAPEKGRRTRAQVLVSAGGGYMLRLEPGALDAGEFEKSLAQARGLRAAGDMAGALSSLDGALALWRGTAFAGVPGPFAEAERQRMDELRTAAAEEHADLMLGLDRAAEAIPDLTTLTAEHPLRERARGLLMIALYRCGRQAEALQVFYDIRERLVEDLGIDPGAELNQIHQQVLAMDPALDGVPRGVPAATAAAPPRVSSAVPAMLAAPVATGEPAAAAAGAAVPASGTADTAEPARTPAQMPPDTAGFAGRLTELGLLRSMLPAVGDGADTSGSPGGPAVAIITGTAGVGKTTLAIRFARQATARFPDGQLYVNLRGFDPSGSAAYPVTVLRGFFEALGVPSHQVPPDVEGETALFRSLLNGKRMLLLLDNARSTEQIRPLLPSGPGCMVVITSRSQLTGLVAAEGARLLPLDVLSGTEARELLAGRLGEDRVAAEPIAAGELILRSSGLPLALSVTCARAVARPGLALADLAAELRDVRRRLDVLQTDDATTDLRAVFSWSYDRLSAGAARMFRLLGVHPSPDISAAAAASLAGTKREEAAAMLAELTRASLLTEESSGRFMFHDLLRAYAAERAAGGGENDGGAEREQARLRLVDHYARSAYAGALRLFPGTYRIGLAPPVPGVTPREFRSHEEALEWFDDEQHALHGVVALAAERGYDDYCWKLAWHWSLLLKRRALLHEAIAVLRTALVAARRLRDAVSLGHVHNELGHAYARLGKAAEASTHLGRAIEMFSRLDDQGSIAEVQQGLVVLYERQGAYAQALPHAREALRLRHSSGDRAVVARSENAVGWIHANLGDYEEALRHCKRALDLHGESGGRGGAADTIASADTLDSIAFAYAGLGDFEQAMDHYAQALTVYRDYGDPDGESGSLTRLGDAQFAAGLLADARHSWRQALALLARVPGRDSGPVVTRLSRVDAALAGPPGILVME